MARSPQHPAAHPIAEGRDVNNMVDSEAIGHEAKLALYDQLADTESIKRLFARAFPNGIDPAVLDETYPPVTEAAKPQ